MENIINSVKNLIGTYGFGAATVIVLTIVIVNLLKKPILKYAEKFAKEKNCDKAVFTRYISYLPFAVSLVLTFFWRLFASGFDFVGLDWGGLVSSSVMYAAVAIATYESVKVNLRAYAAKKNAADAKANADGNEGFKTAETKTDQGELPNDAGQTGTKADKNRSAGLDAPEQTGTDAKSAEDTESSAETDLTASKLVALAKKAIETGLSKRGTGSAASQDVSAEPCFSQAYASERKTESGNAEEAVMRGYPQGVAASCFSRQPHDSNVQNEAVMSGCFQSGIESRRGEVSQCGGSTVFCEPVMSGFAGDGDQTRRCEAPQDLFGEEPQQNGDYSAPRNY